MRETTPSTPSEKRPDARRLGRLFKVLVMGGAVLATAYSMTFAGSPAAADPDGGDGGGGGTQGW